MEAGVGGAHSAYEGCDLPVPMLHADTAPQALSQSYPISSGLQDLSIVCAQAVVSLESCPSVLVQLSAPRTQTALHMQPGTVTCLGSTTAAPVPTEVLANRVCDGGKSLLLSGLPAPGEPQLELTNAIECNVSQLSVAEHGDGKDTAAPPGLEASPSPQAVQCPIPGFPMLG